LFLQWILSYGAESSFDKMFLFCQLIINLFSISHFIILFYSFCAYKNRKSKTLRSFASFSAYFMLWKLRLIDKLEEQQSSSGKKFLQHVFELFFAN